MVLAAALAPGCPRPRVDSVHRTRCDFLDLRSLHDARAGSSVVDLREVGPHFFIFYGFYVWFLWYVPLRLQHGNLAEHQMQDGFYALIR